MLKLTGVPIIVCLCACVHVEQGVVDLEVDFGCRGIKGQRSVQRSAVVCHFTRWPFRLRIVRAKVNGSFRVCACVCVCLCVSLYCFHLQQ